jgi:hypothetical protein
VTGVKKARRLSRAIVNSSSSVRSNKSRGSAKLRTGRMTSSRSLRSLSSTNAYGTATGKGMGMGLSRAADVFDSLLGELQDEPKFGFDNSNLKSKSDVRSGYEDGNVGVS